MVKFYRIKRIISSPYRSWIVRLFIVLHMVLAGFVTCPGGGGSDGGGGNQTISDQTSSPSSSHASYPGGHVAMDGCNHIGHGYNRQYWPYGLLELACLVVYAVEVAAHLRVFGVSYYFDKRWMLVFLFVSSCCTLDHITCYVGGMNLRWSASIRSFMLVAKSSKLRRLMRTIILCIPRIMLVFRSVAAV